MFQDVDIANHSDRLFFRLCVIMQVFIVDISLLHLYEVTNVASVCVCFVYIHIV